jgi:hypothetical protein
MTMGGNIELGSVLSPNLSNSAKIPTSKKANHHNLLGIHGPAFFSQLMTKFGDPMNILSDYIEVEANTHKISSKNQTK